MVKELNIRLKENGIEIIKKCSDDHECGKYLFLNSGTSYFKIQTTNIEIEYDFEEVYPLKENHKERIELRIKAQNLITILYLHIDFDQDFASLFNRLPRGCYH